MHRRALLAAVASVGALAAPGCVGGVFGEDPPLRLRAMRVNGNETDVRCRLPTSVVESSPALGEILSRADETPTGEWATMGVSEQTGGDVVSALDDACVQTGGIYVVDGRPYFVSVTFTSGADAAAHHAGGSHDHTTASD